MAGVTLFNASYSPDVTAEIDNSTAVVEDDIGSETRWWFMALAVIPLWILTGNLLVLLSVIYQRNLRTLSNWVIASLAATDFLLALLVVPLGIYQVVTGKWELGLTVCVLWTGGDVFLSTTSILHLSAIAIHRYHGIANPLRVRSVRDKRHVAVLVVPAWSISFAISLPLVVQGALDEEHVLLDSSQSSYACGIFDRTFAIYSSLVSFFIPLAIMVFADIRSIQILRRNIKFPLRTKFHKNGRLKPSSSSQTPVVQTSKESSFTESVRNESTSVTHCPLVEFKPCTEIASEADLVNPSPQASPHLTPDIPRRCMSAGQRSNARQTTTYKYKGRSRSKSMVYITMLASRGAVKLNSRERRAERTLIWVFVCFVVLWLPFFCTNLTYGVCKTCNIPADVVNAFTWLGYLSSGVNPCIYTLLNRDFRNAFRKLLTCRHNQLTRNAHVYS